MLATGGTARATVTFHSLRHSYASLLIDADVNVVRVAKLLGYASPTMTLDVYAKVAAKIGISASPR